jgi:ATP-dependent DNA helicase RecQ
MEAGYSLLDGQLRQPLFVNFMRRRTEQPDLDVELRDMLGKMLSRLARAHRFRFVVPIPSRTWQQRLSTAAFAAARTGANASPNLLGWREPPQSRQGELLNNDQRRDNVHGRMQLLSPDRSLNSLNGNEAILLLDDYIGSGATMKEAVRVLRAEGNIKVAIVPITIARVRWRLGARGMI